MRQDIIEAYSEVDTILSYMSKQYLDAIPIELRNMFKEKKDKQYAKEIIPDQPLEEQNLKEETLSILAVLNYNYWCNDEEHKNELRKNYYNNEVIYQNELKEKYNPDNLFKNDQNKEQYKSENVQMIEYREENIFQKLFNKIKKFLFKN